MISSTPQKEVVNRFEWIVNFTSFCVAIISLIVGYQHHLHETHGSPFIRASFGLTFIPFAMLLKYFYKHDDEFYETYIAREVHRFTRKYGHLVLNIAMTLVVTEGNIY